MSPSTHYSPTGSLSTSLERTHLAAKANACSLAPCWPADGEAMGRQIDSDVTCHDGPDGGSDQLESRRQADGSPLLVEVTVWSTGPDSGPSMTGAGRLLVEVCVPPWDTPLMSDPT